jgi:hypothetical protein
MSNDSARFTKPHNGGSCASADKGECQQSFGDVATLSSVVDLYRRFAPPGETAPYDDRADEPCDEENNRIEPTEVAVRKEPGTEEQSDHGDRANAYHPPRSDDERSHNEGQQSQNEGHLRRRRADGVAHVEVTVIGD